MRLKDDIRNVLLKDFTIRAKIGLLTEKHPATVDRWCHVNANHGPLTGWSVLRLIADELQESPGNLVTDEEPYTPTTFTR